MSQNIYNIAALRFPRSTTLTPFTHRASLFPLLAQWPAVMSWQLPPIEVAATAVTLGCSLLSFVGSGFILVCYSILPLRHHFRHILIINLAIAGTYHNQYGYTAHPDWSHRFPQFVEWKCRRYRYPGNKKTLGSWSRLCIQWIRRTSHCPGQLIGNPKNGVVNKIAGN